jgi:hypothetical protein
MPVEKSSSADVEIRCGMLYSMVLEGALLGCKEERRRRRRWMRMASVMGMVMRRNLVLKIVSVNSLSRPWM